MNRRRRRRKNEMRDGISAGSLLEFEFHLSIRFIVTAGLFHGQAPLSENFEYTLQLDKPLQTSSLSSRL